MEYFGNLPYLIKKNTPINNAKFYTYLLERLKWSLKLNIKYLFQAKKNIYKILIWFLKRGKIRVRVRGNMWWRGVKEYGVAKRVGS